MTVQRTLTDDEYEYVYGHKRPKPFDYSKPEFQEPPWLARVAIDVCQFILSLLAGAAWVGGWLCLFTMQWGLFFVCVFVWWITHRASAALRRIYWSWSSDSRP